MATRLDQTLAALADPTRREILRRLAHSPQRAGELARGFSISRPAVCKHTRLLARAGLIRATKSGRERIYQLAPPGRKAVGDAIVQLQEMERYWDFVLQAFKSHVEKKR